jgi:phage head maturation protease
VSTTVRRSAEVVRPGANAREVVAYAARFGHLSLSETGDGRPCLVRFTPGCFARWLASDPTGVEVVVNHAERLDGAGPSAVLDEAIGTFSRFETDAVGLRTVAVYDSTPLATETLDAIRRGTLTAYSLRASVIDSRSNGRAKNGWPIFDILDAELTEAGPTPDPADQNARILSVGGLELRTQPDPAIEPTSVASILAYMSSITGLDNNRILEQIDNKRRHAKWRAQDQVAAAESLARVIKRARRKIDIFGSERRHTGNAEAGQLWHAATRVEREALAELHELLCHDAALIRQVLARAGAGGPTPTSLLPPAPTKRRRQWR